MTPGGSLRLLLTSAGIKNPSIHAALVDLLGKPIAESSALCVPTAAYGHPMAGPAAAWRFISGRESRNPLCELGWKSLGVLELTALPSIAEEHWVPMVQETDALLVGGGDPRYLAYWMRQSGLADLVAGRDGLRRSERRERGDGPQRREGLRRLDSAHRRRECAGRGRFFDLSAPGSRGATGPLHGRRRNVGRRLAGVGVRDRRRDRYQSDRRCRRSRLRGGLEVVHTVGSP